MEKRAVLRGVTGKYSGQSFDLLKGKVVIGRDPATCNIVFDKNTPGISGRHCQVVYDPNEDCFIITDLGSSYGTFLGNGKKLTANMAGYCLKNGRIQEAWGEDAAGRELAAVFHLTADGEMKELHEFPALSEGEGALAYAGEFYIEPLEVQIEFLKAANAEKWLEALLLRHVDRVRQVSEELFFIAEIKSFGA